MTNGTAIIRASGMHRYPDSQSLYLAKSGELRLFLALCHRCFVHFVVLCVKSTRPLCAKAKHSIAEYNREFAALITYGVKQGS